MRQRPATGLTDVLLSYIFFHHTFVLALIFHLLMVPAHKCVIEENEREGWGRNLFMVTMFGQVMHMTWEPNIVDHERD